jgi:Arsenical resistance operon protein ArsD
VTRFQVYDPPMCCSTGICGPQVDPVLPRFAEDFHWLANQGILVERYNLSQQPQEFAGNPAVRETLSNDGTSCLPLILVNGRIASKGRYPIREELIQLVGLQSDVAPTSAFVIAESCKPGSGCC